jgi:5S rRNA maturation endonuclease (ribonuclease M5)
MEFDVVNRANLFAGLNDHGKSNVFRAIHLFFTGTAEPGLPFHYDQEICRWGARSQKRIEIEVFFDSTILHKNLLDSIKRRRVYPGAKISIRKTWTAVSGGFSMRIDIRIFTEKGTVTVFTDGDYKGTQKEKVIPPHAPVKFREEIERLFARFRIRYLPSNASGELFAKAGLANEVKQHLFDGFQTGRGSNFQKASESLKSLRRLLDEISRVEFGDKISKELSGVFPGLESASISLPDDVGLINMGDLRLHRSDVGVPISSCGSGLQSVVILETLRFLDENIRTRGKDLKKHVIWLIEEPEAFLYEDLVTAVSRTLSNAAENFTVMATTHSRDFANATGGQLRWIGLDADGSSIRNEFDLSVRNEQKRFADFAGEQFGRGWVELFVIRKMKELENAPATPVVFVEGKTDKIILEKLFQVFPVHSGIEIFEGITDMQSNARQVAQSAAALARMDPGRKVVGLFDNDYEGVVWHAELQEIIDREKLTRCFAVHLPCPSMLHSVEVGYYEGIGDRTVASGEMVDLDRKGIAIEAFFDHVDHFMFLKEKGFVYDHWYCTPSDQPSKPVYKLLSSVGEMKKVFIAQEIGKKLTKENAGSLRLVRNAISKVLELPPISPRLRTRPASAADTARSAARSVSVLESRI